jgi:hypothetical protein
MKQLLLSLFLCIALRAVSGPPPPANAVYPFLDTFDNYVPPVTLGTVWTGTAMGFSTYAGHGDLGTTAMSKNLNQSSTRDSINTPLIGPLTALTILTFDYRIVDSASYPNVATQLPADAEFVVGMRAGAFGPFTTVVNINANSHNASTGFVNVNVPIGVNFSSFVGSTVVFKVLAVRGSSGNYFVDIDNFSVADGTPLSLQGMPAGSKGFSVSTVGGKLQIFGNEENGNIEIYDLSGRKVLMSTISQASGISIGDWPEGIYFARYSDKISKFIVKN